LSYASPSQIPYPKYVLTGCLTIAVKDALKHLPQEINDTYDQAMLRIDKHGVNRQRAVKKHLLRISHAERPRSMIEVDYAPAISRGVRGINDEHIVRSTVLTSLRAGLLIMDEYEQVRLMHKTAEKPRLSDTVLMSAFLSLTVNLHGISIAFNSQLLLLIVA
jgi:hypothetical protein